MGHFINTVAFMQQHFFLVLLAITFCMHICSCGTLLYASYMKFYFEHAKKQATVSLPLSLSPRRNASGIVIYVHTYLHLHMHVCV